MSGTYRNTGDGTINPRVEFKGLKNDDHVTFISMENIDEEFAQADTSLTRPYCKSKGYTLFNESDLLWAKITPCMQNGKSAIATGLVNKMGFGSTECHIFRPMNPNLDIHFMHAILRLKILLKYAVLFFSGSAGHQRVDTLFFRELVIPFPPLDIQKKIAGEITNRIEKAKQLREKAEEVLKQAKQKVEQMIWGGIKGGNYGTFFFN